MRVLTLNVYARHADWSERRERLAAGIRSLRPDVIARHETVVTVTSCKVVFDELIEGVWASDHFGMVADLTAVP